MAWYHDHLKSYGAKIVLPKYLESRLPRENLMKIFESTPLDQAVCLIAPFGYGKMQTVLQWLSKYDDPCAYYCLDESDNQIDLLIGGLTATILSALDLSAYSDDQLDYQSYSGHPREFLYKLATLAKSTSGRHVLVIKGIHRLTDSAALEQLKSFIESILGDWKVLLIDCKMLPPMFNHLVIIGRIRPVTTEDLRLNPTQIGIFLAQGGVEAKKFEIDEIWACTQGWFAALNTILKTSIEDGRLNYGNDARNIFMDFMDTNIWKNLDQETRDFLMSTSIMDILVPSACFALTDVSDAKRMLEHLRLQCIFTFLIENGSYQYHPVFREFLSDKLEKSNIDINGLYIKYGWWLYRQRLYADAFHCFLQIKFLYGIDKILEWLDPTVMSIENLLAMVSGITDFDPHELKQYPNIVSMMSMVEYLTGNLRRMQELKEVFLTWSEPGFLMIDTQEYAKYYWERCWLLLIDPCIPFKGNKQIYDLLKLKDYVFHLESLFKARMAVLTFPSILRGIRDFSEITDTIEDFIFQTDAGTQQAISNEYVLLLARLILAEYYYETDALTQAMKQLHIVLPLAAELTNAKLYFCCIALLTKIMRALGDTDEIDELVTMLEKKIEEKNSNFLLSSYHAFLQFNVLAAGGVGFLQDFYDENHSLLETNHFYLLYRKLTYARTLISLKKYHNAGIILVYLENLCERYKRILDLIEVLLLKSVSLYSVKDETHAMLCLKKAYELAKPYGYIRVFSDEARALMPMLNLFQSEYNDEYLKKIIISAKKSTYGTDINQQKNSYVALTKTELIILNLLQQNLSYDEMALEQGVKLTTVKKHTQSIYGKLGVRNKVDAIAAAICQGIIN